MMKLYIGSLGTLAVIAETTLKLRPLPSSQQLTWATYVSLEAAAAAARRLLASGLLPNAIELVNPSITTFLCQRVNGPAGSAGGWSLLVGIDGAEAAVDRQRREINALSQTCGASAWWTGADNGDLWQALLDRFRPSRAALMDHAVIRVGTVRTRVEAILDKLTDLSSRLDTPMELSARVGNGLIYASFRLKGDAEQSAHLTEMLTAVRQGLSAERGYMVVESAPPALKTQFDCWGDVGPQAEVMVGLKRAFDPRRVLNPGRFVAHL
jgi:FAD/FMN-containing dehydrogenase